MTKMLERLLGETIQLEFPPPPELPAIEGDIGMIEQVIMNLSVNARDAMPQAANSPSALTPSPLTTTT